MKSAHSYLEENSKAFSQKCFFLVSDAERANKFVQLEDGY